MRFLKNINKTKLYLFCFICLILLFPIVLNGFMFSNFNIKNVIQKNPFFKSGNIMVIKQNQINKDESFKISEPNGVGVRIFSYKYTIDNLPNRIKGFSIKTTSQLNKNVIISIKTLQSSYQLSADKAIYRSNNELLWVLNEDNVLEATISCDFDVFTESTQKNSFFRLLQISANTDAQKNIINKRYLVASAWSLVITILIVLLLLIVGFSNADKYFNRLNLPLEKKFLIAAFLIGLTFSVLLPIYQAPDESTHISMIYDELNWDFDVHKDVGDFSDSLRILRNPEEKVNMQTYFNFSSKLPIPTSFSVPSIMIIRHLPQVIPLVVCTFLKIPSFIAFALCELSALCFSVFICYFAIKLMPVKKDMLMFVMLLPISIQQMGTLSYDVMAIPLSFLLFAYILKLKLENEFVTIKDALFVFSLTCIIGLVKIPYAPIAILWLLIPISKYRFSFGRIIVDGEFIKRHKIIFIAILAIAGSALACGIIILSRKNEYVRVVLAGVTDPVGAIRIIHKSFSEFLTTYLHQLTSSFGWFDTDYSPIFFGLIMSCLILTTFIDDCKKVVGETTFYISKTQRILILILGLFICCIIQASMFTWTLLAFNVKDISKLSLHEFQTYFYSLPYIGGVQGRYFLPIIPIILFPFSSKRIKSFLQRINTRFAFVVVYIISFLNITATLCNRYWI